MKTTVLLRWLFQIYYQKSNQTKRENNAHQYTTISLIYFLAIFVIFAPHFWNNPILNFCFKKLSNQQPAYLSSEISESLKSTKPFLSWKICLDGYPKIWNCQNDKICTTTFWKLLPTHPQICFKKELSQKVSPRDQGTRKKKRRLNSVTFAQHFFKLLLPEKLKLKPPDKQKLQWIQDGQNLTKKNIL